MNPSEISIKEKAIKAIYALPNNVGYDDIMEQILFLSKLDTALKERDKGEYLSHEEVEARLKRKWQQ
jgi:predicted transcriptional regulator